MSAGSATDLWAVGEHGETGIVERSDGTTWGTAQHPKPGVGFELSAVSALPTGEAWAAGYEFGAQLRGPIIEHWDGTQWLGTALPASTDYIDSVAAAASDDVWAVGQRDNGTTFRPAVENWDGTSWQVVPSPYAGHKFGGELMSVTVDPSGLAWAAGEYSDNGDVAGQRNALMLVEQWNGTAWVRDQIVDPGGKNAHNNLLGISAVSSTDAWAVGERCTASVAKPTCTSRVAIVHWDGTSWTRTAVGGVKLGGSLVSVSADSSADAWAVGFHYTSQGGARALIEHWDGSTWSSAPAPAVNGHLVLTSVVTLSPTNAWAVGGDSVGPVVLHWDGTAWTVSQDAPQ